MNRYDALVRLAEDVMGRTAPPGYEMDRWALMSASEDFLTAVLAVIRVLL